jgi:hypothetical protein
MDEPFLMTAYSRLLDLARAQVASASAGDLDSAIALMGDRKRILDSASAAAASDTATIREILELDRKTAGFIRERMLAIRDDARATRRGQSAISGYGATMLRTYSRIDTSL